LNYPKKDESAQPPPFGDTFGRNSRANCRDRFVAGQLIRSPHGGIIGTPIPERLCAHGSGLKDPRTVSD